MTSSELLGATGLLIGALSCICLLAIFIGRACALGDDLAKHAPRTTPVGGPWQATDLDTDTRSLIERAQAREDAVVASLDEIPVPGEWSIPPVWRTDA